MSLVSSELHREKELILGTVQFGVAYGIAGRGAPVSEVEVLRILDHAVESGVRTLDTAAAYGDIEQRLHRLIGARPLTVISKIPSLPQMATPAEAASLCIEHAARSLGRLEQSLTTLMFHRSDDLVGDRGQAVMEALLPWANKFGIRIGVSGYRQEDVSACKIHHGGAIQVAQLPGNALDQRVDTAQARMDLKGVEIHLRSAFLQGLLLMEPADAYRRLPGATQVVSAWHYFCTRLGIAPLHAALGTVKSFPAVSAVVLGVDSLDQWRQITAAWRVSAPIEAISLACEANSPIIDPRQWETLK